MLVAYGSQGLAELESGETVPCQFRRSVGRPLCGDRVILNKGAEGGWSVDEICERQNVFARADRGGGKQLVAANLDQVLIVIAPKPTPSRDLVERYLVAVHSLGIQPVLVINKSEISPPPGPTADTAFDRIDAYRKLGYSVLNVSCKAAPGINALLPVVAHSTSILVGQSGVGKSSLVNQLIPDLELQTSALSRTTGKGTHTTTTTIMYSLPGQGRMIDSPGVWEYGLWAMHPQELASGFPEFQPHLHSCRFNDCRHAGEPGCAIVAALESGQLLDWRYQSYLRLLAQAGQ